MSQDDMMLRDLWAHTQAPARDPGFGLQVMARVERRRFWLSLAALLPLTLATAVAAWALLPLMAQLGQGSLGAMSASTLASVVAGLSLVALVLDRRAHQA